MQVQYYPLPYFIIGVAQVIKEYHVVSFVKCLSVTGNYFFACAHFRRRNWLDPHCALLQILCAEKALLHTGNTGARIIYIEEDQALHFETSLLGNTYD